LLLGFLGESKKDEGPGWKKKKKIRRSSSGRSFLITPVRIYVLTPLPMICDVESVVFQQVQAKCVGKEGCRNYNN
jgi:hypothetical protein